MPLLDSVGKWLTDKLVATTIDRLPVENKYQALGVKGKLLSYVESQPIINALLESSLGPNRVKLYQALTENADDLVCAILSFHFEGIRADRRVYPEKQTYETPTGATSGRSPQPTCVRLRGSCSLQCNASSSPDISGEQVPIPICGWL